ncbi:beta propeller repeat protein [Paraburkholderia bannensis]|uniref:hypothetical protein n=1 Tax=Paraburkholderia bannensis TaxID=765414 RepID=UPI002AB65AFE|nr:hypothetical protein [Paraburkholderia bannensis]
MDARNTVGAECYFITGCAVEDDIVYLAAQLEDVDSSEYTHTRVNVYVGRFEPGRQWYSRDLNTNIVSVCVKKATDFELRQLVALSKEGEVEFYTTKGGASTQEKIPDAGLRLGDLGYMRSIREIGHAIFACGYNNQVYVREDGLWKSMTMGPLQYHHAASDSYGILNAIDGFSERNLYVVGWKGTVYHWDGHHWRKIHVKTEENLTCVRCYGQDEVWIGGGNGTLLKGNFSVGFNDVGTFTDNENFWSLTKYKDQIYLASTNALYVFDGRVISRVTTRLVPEIETYTVDSTNDILWSIGAKDLVSFDGSVWKRYDHPDNPSIQP